MIKKLRSAIATISQQEDINFLLTNRIPRRLVTRFFGWFSQIEQPLIRDISIGVWRLFADLDLSDARESRFRSLHDCFIRRLRDGARPIDTDTSCLVSPCDAIVGASGSVQGGEILQIKGFPYQLRDLLGNDEHADFFRNGCYVTLRLTSAMYHRFHAPHDGCVESITYVAGDTWNVNPVALKRVERLFCKNERALIRIRLHGSGHGITLVPVAAILVWSIRFSFFGARQRPCAGAPRTTSLNVALSKGEEMGWFQHGSTIIVFAPVGFTLASGIHDGVRIRVGQPLMFLPHTTNELLRTELH
jgi:phosphatidylserine decarboxylase